MPLRELAAQMRDVYANEIALALHEGRTVPPAQLAAWVQYRDAATADDPNAAMRQLAEGAGPQDVGEFLTPAEAAAVLGISELEVHSRIGLGTLRPALYQGAIRLLRSEVERSRRFHLDDDRL